MPYNLAQSSAFSGTSQWLQNNSGFGLSTSSPHTFETWIRIPSQPSTNTNRGLWTLYLNGAGFRVMYEDASGTKRLNVFRHAWGISTSGVPHNITLTTNVWYHVAYSFSSGNVVVVYINGTQVASGSVGTDLGNFNPLTSTLGASAGNSSPETVWNGNISLARLWSVVRTQSEISANMCNVFGGATTNLIAEWALDGAYTSTPSNTYPWTNNSSTFVAATPAVCIPPFTPSPMMHMMQAAGGLL